MPVEEIISGGQTGADRAAWDVAIALGLRYGGWVPAGRLDEEHGIPERYRNLKETEKPDFETRTRFNVLDSDATLILSYGELLKGSKDTWDFAERANKPRRHIPLPVGGSFELAIDQARTWIADVGARRLNVAGPRASEEADIYFGTVILLTGVLLTSQRPPQNENLTAALQLRESTLSWMRHWDQIRWQVPYWFCTLATAGAAVWVTTGVRESIGRVWWVCVLFAIFGGCSLRLLCNLTNYHRDALRIYNLALNELHLNPNQQIAAEIRLPFDYDKAGIRRTATYYFRGYIWLLLILAILGALFGVLIKLRIIGR